VVNLKIILKLNNGRIWKRKINAAMTLRKIIIDERADGSLRMIERPPIVIRTLDHELPDSYPHHEPQNLISMYIIPPASATSSRQFSATYHSTTNPPGQL